MSFFFFLEGVAMVIIIFFKKSRPTYYYRPSSNEKVRVVPIGTVDLALEENVESGEVRPVVR